MSKGLARAEPSRAHGVDDCKASRANLPTWSPTSFFLHLTAACRRIFPRSCGEKYNGQAKSSRRRQQVEASHSNNHSSSSSTSSSSSSGGGGGGGASGGISKKPVDFLQSLPQNIVFDILSRLPRSQHGSIRAVSRAGRAAVSSRALFETRAATGRQEQLLFVLTQQSARGSFRAYDPQSNSWQRVPPMPQEAGDLRGFACAAAAGKLLVMGGTRNAAGASDSSGDVSRRVWLFDVQTWSWREAAAMHEARCRAAAAVMGNRFVYVCGGQGQSSFLNSAEVYDGKSDSWRPIRGMHMARCRHRAVALGGKFLAISGEVASLNASCSDALLNHSNHCLQRQQQQNSDAAKLNNSSCSIRHHEGHTSKAAAVAAAVAEAAAAAATGNAVWPASPNFGRREDNSPLAHWPTASMEAYDPRTDEWLLLPNSWKSMDKIPCPATVVNGRLYAVQPLSGPVRVWVLDPSSQRWRECGDNGDQIFSTCRQAMYGSDCEEICGRLVIFGGVLELWRGNTLEWQQQLQKVYAWQPPARQLGPAATERPSNFEGPFKNILTLEELAPMAGMGGNVLAAATVAF